MKNFTGSKLQSTCIISERVIATPSPKARSAFFFVQETGSLRCLQSYRSERSQLDSYLFLIVLSGSGKIHYRGTDFNMKTGDCAWIDCRIPYYHESNPDDLWELSWVHFYGATTPAYYRMFEEKGSAKFHPYDLSTYVNLLNQLYDIHKQAAINYELLSSKLLVTLMTEILNHDQRQNVMDTQNSCKLESIRCYIDEHYNDKLSLDMLATQFFISKFYLCREFKEMFGFSINSYLTQKRVNRAKELLRFSNKPIQEIAIECGIPDANYFNKVFKKLENMTATEYRALWNS